MNALLSTRETDSSSAAAEHAGWQAGIELGFRRENPAGSVNNKTLLDHRRRYGPLAVQRPFYPEGDICHVYLLHPPGGIVGGDQLEIGIEVADGASALVTAPGATKFYRSQAQSASITARFEVAGDLEWLPQENIVFRGAEVQQQCSVNLHQQSRYIGWEIHCFGRPAGEQGFDEGNAMFATQISREGRPLQMDRLLVSPASRRSDAAGLRGHWVTATLYATPVENHLLRDLQERNHATNDDYCLGLTLVDDLLVARYLGDSASDARAKLTDIWQQLRPELMGRDVSIPRIWLT